jgi:hypothetical protein
MNALHPTLNQPLYYALIGGCCEDTHSPSGLVSVVARAAVKNQLWTVRQTRTLSGLRKRFIQLDRFLLIPIHALRRRHQIVRQTFLEHPGLVHHWCPVELLSMCPEVKCATWRQAVHDYHRNIDMLQRDVSPVPVSAGFALRGITSIRPIKRVCKAGSDYVIGEYDRGLYQVPVAHLIH